VGNLVGGEGKVAVILTHMMGANRASWLSFAKLIATKGFTALIFDFRGFGASGGSFSYSKQPWDVLTAVEFLHERGYEHIVCMGASIGGTACVEAALLGADFEGLGVISGEVNLTVEEAASLTMPKLLACEEGAPQSALDEMAAAHELLPEPKAFEIIPSKAHGTDLLKSAVGDEFRQLLLDFLGGLHSPTRAPAVEKIADVPYVADGDPKQRLDVYLPTSQNGPYPTLLVIHGGGGDKRDLAKLALRFVKLDYAVISINHRIMPQNKYPAQVQDAFCALAWTHANADDYDFDPGRIVALGHSSGGTLAAMLGTVDDPNLYLEDCPYPLPEAHWVQGVVPFTGIFDYTSAAASSSGLRSYINSYLGAEEDADPDIWAEASPMTWIDGSEAPFLLIHGAADENIDPDQSVDFADVLEQAGVDMELLLIPGADHGVIIRSEQSFEAVEDFLVTLDAKQALFIIQEHFNASEYSKPRTTLKIRGVVITVAAPSLDTVTAYAGEIEVQPDILLSDAHAADYDVVVFVGGFPYDANDQQAHRIAQEAVAEGKLVAGICNGVIAMANAGILQGKQVTALIHHPDSDLESQGAILSEADVERDGLIITGNGPDASKEFGEAIAAALEE
jgi:acetyl esterase/lipase/putative intracellular protease/amidase